MSVAITVFGALAIFFALMFLCMREATTLALFLASVNALAIGFMQNDIRYSGAVFVLSFAVIMLFAAVTTVIVSIQVKRRKR